MDQGRQKLLDYIESYSIHGWKVTVNDPMKSIKTTVFTDRQSYTLFLEKIKKENMMRKIRKPGSGKQPYITFEVKHITGSTGKVLYGKED